MRAVFLDYRSIDTGDLDRGCLQRATGDWQWHDATVPEEIRNRIAGAEIVCTNKVPLDRSVLEQSPDLKLICIAATGTDKVDLAAASELGVRVCNVTAYATQSVVQHVFSLILALTTRLLSYHRDVPTGVWQAQSNFCLLDHPITELAGKKLGVLGYGELGHGVARIAEAFGVQVRIGARPGSTRPVSDASAEEGRRVWVALGGNLGDRARHLREALAELAGPDLAVEAVSSLYETPPWGVVRQPPFANAVARLRTPLAPAELLARMQRIEQAHGRDRAGLRNGPRPLYLDLLLVDGVRLGTEALTVPHPRMHERAFVLVPLCEIDPDLRHPTLGRTVRELAAAVDAQGVSVITGPGWWGPAGGSAPRRRD